uniref:Uncharacterized protein n=1 Tax=Sinocyclocheilus grahami TaxID=75366 RepID=A0A672LWJ0_SINGR
MTTTTNFQGMEPGAKNSSRSETKEELEVMMMMMMVTNNCSTTSVWAYLWHDVISWARSDSTCISYSSAPLRRCQPVIVYDNGTPVEQSSNNTVSSQTQEEVVEQKEEAAQPSAPSAANNPSGRRNPPGGKSSLILG